MAATTLVCACAFDSDAGKGGVATLGDDDGTSTAASPTTGPVSSATQGSMSMSASGDPTMPPTDPSPSDPTNASGTTVGSASATDPSASGDSTTAADPSTGRSVSATESSSSTGPPPVPYPPCPDGDDDCDRDSVCIELYSGEALYGTWCGETGCDGNDDCDVPATGTAAPQCVGSGVCVLDCSAGGETCPEDMRCDFVGGSIQAWRCNWPV